MWRAGVEAAQVFHDLDGLFEPTGSFVSETPEKLRTPRLDPGSAVQCIQRHLRQANFNGYFGKSVKGPDMRRRARHRLSDEAVALIEIFRAQCTHEMKLRRLFAATVSFRDEGFGVESLAADFKQNPMEHTQIDEKAGTRMAAAWQGYRDDSCEGVKKPNMCIVDLIGWIVGDESLLDGIPPVLVQEPNLAGMFPPASIERRPPRIERELR